MSETVRLASDGEELVLSQGEALRVYTPDADASVRQTPSERPSPPIAIQYLGFQNGPDRREYSLGVRHGGQMRRYTLWIAQAAFADRRALLQDGPDICYQRLVQELAALQMGGTDYIQVTDVELAAYRETHTRSVRRGISPQAKPSEKDPSAIGPGQSGR